MTVWNNGAVFFQSIFFNASAIQETFEEKVKRKINKRKEGKKDDKEEGKKNEEASRVRGNITDCYM